MTEPLTIALNRGRILDEFLPLLAASGIEPDEPMAGSRRLIFDSKCGRARLVVMRGADVPTYVAYGAADIGVTGKDTLLEYGGAGFYERMDLGIARCRIVSAAPIGAVLPSGRLRIATKFVNVAKRYYAEQGRQVEVIRLSGAMEIAPLMGLADLIVDIVDTGNTLRANGLEALDTIAHISTRVIINRASLKMRFAEIEALLDNLRTVVDDSAGPGGER
ncbi:MAG: ATP phosphoribosyltransferase [Gammaproteobacteria bacterium]|nr:MAG: ATP phosphoribosyltransferase [Gammaproteobacteria bacterium]TDJ41951.1 MAG: ATP phosphoribosyltransferase [Gammaproteobacteria bacterium]